MGLEWFCATYISVFCCQIVEYDFTLSEKLLGTKISVEVVLLVRNWYDTAVFLAIVIKTEYFRCLFYANTLALECVIKIRVVIAVKYQFRT